MATCTVCGNEIKGLNRSATGRVCVTCVKKRRQTSPVLAGIGLGGVVALILILVMSALDTATGLEATLEREYGLVSGAASKGLALTGFVLGFIHGFQTKAAKNRMGDSPNDE
jgi:hypothetical protein